MCVVLKVLFVISVLIFGFLVESTTSDFDQRLVGEWKSDHLVKFIVSIRKKFIDEHYCAGSILNEHFIITAAHCLFYKNKSLRALHKTWEIEVVAGVSYRLKNQRTMQKRDVLALIPHEKFRNHFADIGLIKLNGTLRENDRSVQRVSLNFNEPNTSALYVAYGWGRLSETGPLADKVRYVFLTIQEDEVCYRRPYSMPLGDICTIANGFGTCYGDSGGPLLIIDGSFGLTGVTSYGTEPCGTVSYFTSIYFYQDWIERIVKTNTEQYFRSCAKPKLVAVFVISEVGTFGITSFVLKYSNFY